MARYHFNVWDGVYTPDLDGTEFTTFDAARTEAVRLSGALLKDDADGFWTHEDWRLDLTDASGAVLFTLRFAVSAQSGATASDAQQGSERPARARA